MLGGVGGINKLGKKFNFSYFIATLWMDCLDMTSLWETKKLHQGCLR